MGSVVLLLMGLTAFNFFFLALLLLLVLPLL